MLHLPNNVVIPDAEIEMQAVRAQGAGGQHVNKVASAIHLRFDIPASSLPDPIKERLLALQDQRISSEGIVVIKSQSSRSQWKNRQNALNRLLALIVGATRPPKKRKATRATQASKRRRLEEKKKRGSLKSTRRRPELE